MYKHVLQSKKLMLKLKDSAEKEKINKKNKK